MDGWIDGWILSSNSGFTRQDGWMDGYCHLIQDTPVCFFLGSAWQHRIHTVAGMIQWECVLRQGIRNCPLVRCLIFQVWSSSAYLLIVIACSYCNCRVF